MYESKKDRKCQQWSSILTSNWFLRCSY